MNKENYRIGTKVIIIQGDMSDLEWERFKKSSTYEEFKEQGYVQVEHTTPDNVYIGSTVKFNGGARLCYNNVKQFFG